MKEVDGDSDDDAGWWWCWCVEDASRVMGVEEEKWKRWGGERKYEGELGIELGNGSVRVDPFNKRVNYMSAF